MIAKNSFKILGLFICFSAGAFLETNALLDAHNKYFECAGGALNGDTNSFNYPGADAVLQPGEICAWTIHLETTNDFRFNFENFSINSNSDCSDGGIRLYSLTNLAPAGNPESYTFCDALPPPANFHIAGTVAVIVLYVGPNNNNAGTGFSVSWQGSAFDPLQTKHSSSFSSATSGVVKFPAVGNYEGNVAATWLVNADRPGQTSMTDISLERLDLESCSIVQDSCYCDALILYEIGETGLLNQTRRFCEDSEGISLQGVGTRFILAFFSDLNLQGDGATGFEFIYTPSGDGLTTPGTTPSPTGPTTQPPVTNNTNCATVLGGDRAGEIIFEIKEGLERCMWTVRIPSADQLKFDLSENSLQSQAFVSIVAFTRVAEPLVYQEVIESTTQQGHSIILNANVAIVMFSAGVHNVPQEGTKFKLNFEGLGESNHNISTRSADVIIREQNGTLDHPVFGQYFPDELTTFHFKPFFFNSGDGVIQVEIETKELEQGCCDCDNVRAYQFDDFSREWSMAYQHCHNSVTPPLISSSPLIYVFSTDSTYNFLGFTLKWENFETHP